MLSYIIYNPIVIETLEWNIQMNIQMIVSQMCDHWLLTDFWVIFWFLCLLHFLILQLNLSININLNIAYYLPQISPWHLMNLLIASWKFHFQSIIRFYLFLSPWYYRYKNEYFIWNCQMLIKRKKKIECWMKVKCRLKFTDLMSILVSVIIEN